MADCYRYLVIFAWLILLKFSVSLPFMGTIAAWIEKYLEVQVDLDFKFRGRFFDWTDVPGEFGFRWGFFFGGRGETSSDIRQVPSLFLPLSLHFSPTNSL